MWLSLIVCCFSIRNGPLRPTNYRSCFSVPNGSILQLLGSRSKSQFCTIRQFSSAPFVSAVLHHSSAQVHRSSVLFCTIHQYSCTIRQYCSATFVSTVLHHSPIQFCTIRQLQFCTIYQFSSAPFISYRSAPFVSSVLHHSLATILRHVIMLFYSSASMNNFANRCKYTLSTI